MQESAYPNMAQRQNNSLQGYCDADAKCAPQSELESVLGQINVLVNAASINADKAAQSAARLMGEIPIAAGSASVRPCRSGLLGEIRDGLDVLSDHLLACDSNLMRLRDAI